MEITEAKVFPVRKPDEKLKAFVTIVLDDCFVVRDLKVIKGHSGFFVAMPSRKKADGTYADIAHPLNNEMRKQIEEIVLREYTRIIQSQEENSNSGENR